MGKNTIVTLGEHFDKFIAEQVLDGRFGSASEVIRAGLRILEEEESKLAMLRSALNAGEKSGLAENYSLNNIMHQLGRD